MPEARRILIVDDEELARLKIRKLLAKRREKFEIAEAANGFEAKERIAEFRPELVFLDIEMPGCDGFQLLANFEKRDFAVVFQTAYDQFAIRAFDEAACDYLLKPFDEERFALALERALSRKPASGIEKLEETRRKEKKYLDSLLVKRGQKSMVVPVGEVLAFRSEDHYTFLKTAAFEVICDLSLAELEVRLDPRAFFRIHRNAIARLGAIRSVVETAEPAIELVNGEKLALSRRQKSRLKELLQAE